MFTIGGRRLEPTPEAVGVRDACRRVVSRGDMHHNRGEDKPRIKLGIHLLRCLESDER